MKILCFPDEYEITDEMIDNCKCYVTVSEDKKQFSIERQATLSNTRLFMKHLGYYRHIGELKSILLAG
jgi:hypothetical protein